jgi:hypothetical protein
MQNSRNASWGREMTPREVSLDDLSLQLYLRVDAASGNRAFKVTLEIGQIDLVVEVIELDLANAVRAAADRCAERLRGRGYAVTAEHVLGALETTVEQPYSRSSAPQPN